MDETAKRTEPQTGDAPVDSGEATVAETVARKAGSAVGAITPKIGGSQTPRDESSEKRTQVASSDAYAKRRLEIKKKKKAAHRRRLKASHTKG